MSPAMRAPAMFVRVLLVRDVLAHPSIPLARCITQTAGFDRAAPRVTVPRTARCGAARRSFTIAAAGVSRMVAAAPTRGRGTSELHRALRWVTPSPGDGKESATENRPPGAEARL